MNTEQRNKIKKLSDIVLDLDLDYVGNLVNGNAKNEKEEYPYDVIDVNINKIPAGILFNHFSNKSVPRKAFDIFKHNDKYTFCFDLDNAGKHALKGYIKASKIFSIAKVVDESEDENVDISELENRVDNHLTERNRMYNEIKRGLSLLLKEPKNKPIVPKHPARLCAELGGQIYYIGESNEIITHGFKKIVNKGKYYKLKPKPNAVSSGHYHRLFVFTRYSTTIRLTGQRIYQKDYSPFHLSHIGRLIPIGKIKLIREYV